MPAPRLRLFKYQTLGNSYLVLNPKDDADLTARLEPTSGGTRENALARVLCDKAWGIGAFGMLYGPEQFQDEPLAFRIINSDGSPAGFSGNGARIFVRYLLDAGYVSPGSSFHIAAIENRDAGAAFVNRIPVTVASDGLSISVTAPQTPAFGLDAVAANREAIGKEDTSEQTGACKVPALARIGKDIVGSDDAWADSTLVFIGNPHCVTFVRSPAHLPDFDALSSASHQLRPIAFRPQPGDATQPVFMNGSNLQWAYVASRKRIRLTIYERGEGPTLASGSSSIATAVAAFARGLVDNTLDVAMPGGDLHIEILGAPDHITGVRLVGTASRIAELWIEETALAQARV